LGIAADNHGVEVGTKGSKKKRRYEVTSFGFVVNQCLSHAPDLLHALSYGQRVGVHSTGSPLFYRGHIVVLTPVMLLSGVYFLS
jgi:hypothetical protein